MRQRAKLACALAKIVNETNTDVLKTSHNRPAYTVGPYPENSAANAAPGNRQILAANNFVLRPKPLPCARPSRAQSALLAPQDKNANPHADNPLPAP